MSCQALLVVVVVGSHHLQVGGRLWGAMEDLVEDARSSFEQAATTLVDQIRSALVDERTGKNAFQLAVEQAQQFYQAVDWSERWIQALVATECFLLILVLVTRNRTTFQGILFVILGKLRKSSKPRTGNLIHKQPPAAFI